MLTGKDCCCAGAGVAAGAGFPVAGAAGLVSGGFCCASVSLVVLNASTTAASKALISAAT